MKREAERVYEYNGGKDSTCARGTAPRKPAGPHISAKRVEQFRKNMRRWLIGVGLGVEWLVWARLEHLNAIARFILGAAVPADPAGPTAVQGNYFLCSRCFFLIFLVST